MTFFIGGKCLAVVLTTTSVFILITFYHRLGDEMFNCEIIRNTIFYGEKMALPLEKRKFVAILTKHNQIKMVYMDNDNMDDIENVAHQYSWPETSRDGTYSYPNSTNFIVDNLHNYEWDETIDYDYEKQAMDKTKRLQETSEKPKKAIVLVQERYHNNHVVTNIMYRYGDLHQLSIALPKKSTFQHYGPLKFHPSFVDTSLIFSNRVNMLLNPTYRYETLRRFMRKDTVFVAVLYNPVTSFVRKYTFDKRRNIIKKLVQRNKVFGSKYIASITSQFGYPRKLESHNLKAKEILNELKAQFDIVLMGEYLDQSLLVMKKALNWSMNDLVYINHVDKNVNYDYGDIAPQIQVIIKEHTKLDQVIYEYFNQTFWKRIESYGSTFTSDIQKLQNLKSKFAHFCKRAWRRGIEGNTVCTRMKWGDEEYVAYFKEKYRTTSYNQSNKSLQYLKESLQFYFNTTSKEIQRYLES